MIEQEIDKMSPGIGENVKYKGLKIKTKLTFFYEKDDETVFAAEEQEAATGNYNKKFRMVGWSDGSQYQKKITEAKLLRGQLIAKEQAENLLREAFDAELKLAKKNLKDAKKNGTFIPRPRRI